MTATVVDCSCRCLLTVKYWHLISKLYIAPVGGPEAKAWWIGLFVRSGRVGGTAGSKGKRSKAEPALTGLAAKEAEDKRIRVTGFRCG